MYQSSALWPMSAIEGADKSTKGPSLIEHTSRKSFEIGQLECTSPPWIDV